MDQRPLESLSREELMEALRHQRRRNAENQEKLQSERKLREEAEEKARVAKAKIAQTTLPQYLDYLEKLVRTQYIIETNPKCRSSSAHTRVEGKRCPDRLECWEDFPRIHEEKFAEISSAIGDDAVFQSQYGIKTLNKIIRVGRIGNKFNSVLFVAIYIELAVMDIVSEYLRRRPETFPMIDGLEIGPSDKEKNSVSSLPDEESEHGSVMEARDKDLQELIDSTQVSQHTFPDRWGKVIKRIPIDTDHMRLDDEHGGQIEDDGPFKKEQVAIFVGEIKAGHIIPADAYHDALVAARPADLFDPWKVGVPDGMVTPNNPPRPPANTGSVVFSAQTERRPSSSLEVPPEGNESRLSPGSARGMAMVLCQAYDYMCTHNLYYGYVSSGFLTILLHVRKENTGTLLYHVVDGYHQDYRKLHLLENPLPYTKTPAAQLATLALLAVIDHTETTSFPHLRNQPSPYSGKVKWKGSSTQKRSQDSTEERDGPGQPSSKRPRTPLPEDRSQDVLQDADGSFESDGSSARTTTTTIFTSLDSDCSDSRSESPALSPPKGATQTDTHDPQAEDLEEPVRPFMPGVSVKIEVEGDTHLMVPKWLYNTEAILESRRRMKAAREAGPAPPPVKPVNPYCTQACLLGLMTQGLMDTQCPNFQQHMAKQSDQSQSLSVSSPYHPLEGKQVMDLLRTQLGRNTYENIELVPGHKGRIGQLFRIQMTDYGYTFVGKGVMEGWQRTLIFEWAVYRHCQAFQGTSIPVCLGVMKTYEEVYVHQGLLYRYFLLMSYAGKTLWDEKPKDVDVGVETDRTINEIYDRCLVVNNDIRDPNLTWCAETKRIMMIDFHRADFIELPAFRYILSHAYEGWDDEEPPSTDEKPGETTDSKETPQDAKRAEATKGQQGSGENGHDDGSTIPPTMVDQTRGRHAEDHTTAGDDVDRQKRKRQPSEEEVEAKRGKLTQH